MCVTRLGNLLNGQEFVYLLKYDLVDYPCSYFWEKWERP